MNYNNYIVIYCMCVCKIQYNLFEQNGVLEELVDVILVDFIELLFVSSCLI